MITFPDLHLFVPVMSLLTGPLRSGYSIIKRSRSCATFSCLSLSSMLFSNSLIDVSNRALFFSKLIITLYISRHKITCII